MASILFVTWDGGGNVVPALGIAADLRECGETVRFLGHPRQAPMIEAAGFPFHPFTHARPWSALSDPHGLQAIRAFLGMLSDNGMGRDLVTTVEREPADLVVIDCMLFGALRAADRTGLRYTVLFHTFYDYFTRHFAKGPIALSALLHGQRPKRLWSKAELALVTTLRSLDPAGARDLPSTIHFTGPVLPPAFPAPGAARPDAEPRILISLSTTRFDGQTEVLQSILDAVETMPIRATVTTADAVDAHRLRVPANVEQHRYVPHADLMPKVSLVVTHGGHSTTMQALAHDLPVVVIPMHPMPDQRWIGKAVAAAGAGTVVNRKSPPATIRAAIGDMLRDGPHRAAAARLGAQLRQQNAAADGADALTALLHP